MYNQNRLQTSVIPSFIFFLYRHYTADWCKAQTDSVMCSISPWIGEHFWGSKVASKVSSSISQMLAIERYHNCLIWILPISVVWLHLLEIKAWNALKIRSYLSPQNPTATQQSKENWVSAPLWEVCFYTVTSTLSTQLTASLAMINRRLKVKLIFFSENASWSKYPQCVKISEDFLVSYT